MTLQEFMSTLENSDRLRIIKDDKEVFTGFLALLSPVQGLGGNAELFDRYKDETVKKFRAILEITHKRWKELKLMKPLEPEQTPEFSFSDLQMSLYYTIYL